MRAIVLSMSVSIDGYFEGPDGDLSWHLVDEELHSHFNEWIAGLSLFLNGRVDYEQMAAYWPEADQDPTASKPEREFAPIWRDMPKIVFSRTLETVGWNSTLRREVDPAEIRALQQEPGGDMTVGGAVLAETFRRHDLIDEYRIYVHPVLLGAGRQLFDPADTPASLRLLETHAFGNGVVLLRYGRPES